ncbi:MAG TPA: YCF48-related protein [Blastocatellia bacterium]|nr:YCF48-related protein [Blastocatellia bacterium]
MNRRVVEKTICCLLAIALSVMVARAQSRSYTIQVESSPSEDEAKSSIAKLQAKGQEAYWVKADVPGKGTRYRIRIGKYKTQAEAKARADKLLGSGVIKEFIVTVYDTPSSDSLARGAVSAPASATTSTTASNGSKPTPSSSAAGERSRTQIGTKAPVDVAAKEAVPNNSGERTINESPAKPEPVPESTKPGAEKSALIDSPPEPRLERAVADPKPEAKAESDPGATPVRKTSARSALKASNAESMIATPATADALADMTISNDNWKIARRSAETDKNLRAIYFVDSMTGWAAGDAGAVFRTTDGGRNWKPLLSGAAANIDFITFIDWNHGWMLGESGGKMGEETESGNILLITTNGGRTWTRKPLPNVTSLYFTDLKTGWAVGRNSTLLKTTDGGLEWSKVESIEKLIGAPIESSNYNFGFSDVNFTDAEHGWVIGNFYGRARSDIGGIFMTSDGGVTWKRVPVTFQTQHNSGRFTSGMLHSIHFSDSNTGSVTGEMYDGDGRFFFALHTRNGGLTWNQIRTPSRATHNSQFLDPANGWTAAFAPREGGAEAVVYDTTLMRTENGGMSWRNDFIARGRRIRGVFFLSPNKGWAVGDRGMILSYEERSKAN